MSREWTYLMWAPARWLNSNDRDKRRPDKVIAAWRGTSSAIAQYAKIPQLQRARITAELRWPDNRRRDAANYMPSIKAAIDGIVLAGVLPDDSDKYLLSLTIQRGPNCERRHVAAFQGALVLTIHEEARPCLTNR